MKLTDYVGAGARLEPEKALALSADRWAFMKKIDGCYARVTLGANGCITSIVSRSGAELSEARELLGIHAGPADSVLHGELECHTEAGNRIASERGWRLLHLFDVTRYAGADVSGDPFGKRYGLLHQAQAAIELAGLANEWTVDGNGDAHSKTSGRFVTPAPQDVRRLPIVQLARGADAAKQLWSSFVESERGEGLVAVRLDAPAGVRNAKRKVKATETLDCYVVSSVGRAARLAHEGCIFVVSASGLQLVPGACVEVACDGWYENGSGPRFARIIRERTDKPRAFSFN